MKSHLITALLCALLPVRSSADTILLVADEYCPYNCTPGSDRPGFMVEIAQKVLSAAGHEVDYKIVPWSRAIEDTRRGKYHALVGAASSDAPGFVLPKTPIGLSAQVFAIRKNHPWRFTGMPSLEKVSIGTVQGYNYSEEFDAYVAEQSKLNTKVQIATGENTLATNLKKLEFGRIDALIDDRLVLEYNLSNQGKLGNIEFAGTLSEIDLYIAFSPAKTESRAYADLLDAGIRQLRASGELAKILARYGLTDWQD